MLGRVQGPGEPLFLEEDLLGALALLEEEDDLCSGCGQPQSESLNPAFEDAYAGRRIVCFSCAEVDRLKADLSGEPEVEAGLRLGVRKTKP